MPVKTDENKCDISRIYSSFSTEQWAPGKTFPWINYWPYVDPLQMGSSQYEIDDQEFWSSFDERKKIEVSRSFQIWRLSQTLHGELAALEYSARLSLLHDDFLVKACCAAQAADEARHASIFKRILSEIGLPPFEMAPSLRSLIDQIKGESRTSLLSLSMQILIEGIGIGAFRRICITSKSPFIRTLYSYLVKDEARHFALGKSIMASIVQIRDEVPSAELEEFIEEALESLQNYITPLEIIILSGYSKQRAHTIVKNSTFMKHFSRTVFGQIAPSIMDLGLDQDSKGYRRIIELAGIRGRHPS
jgi:hypothetical protein